MISSSNSISTSDENGVYGIMSLVMKSIASEIEHIDHLQVSSCNYRAESKLEAAIVGKFVLAVYTKICRLRRERTLLQVLFILLLLLQFHVVPFAAADEALGDSMSRSTSMPEPKRAKVEVQKRPILNFTLSDGDEVGCVPIERQHSLNVGNLTIPYQLRPSSRVKVGNSTTNSRGAVRAEQTFKVEVGACPDGTIPVRRTRDIFNLTSIFSETHNLEDDNNLQSMLLRRQFHKRNKIGPPGFSQPSDSNSTADDEDSPHEHAFVVVNKTEGPFRGMEVILNIWEPYVQNPQEFSLAQFWLISGSYSGNITTSSKSYSTILNTIEAGWQVFEGLYGDNRSRLFIFWTADAYNDTGCYNLYCSGFVQTSNKVVVGGSFTPVSRVNSTQYEIELVVFRDDWSGNWWLVLNDEPVGYWPPHIFTGKMRDAAEYVEFGGEIINSGEHGRHTRTNMGSGYYPEEGDRVAAYQRNIQTVKEDNQLRDARITLGRAEQPACYTARISTQFLDWGSHFFYGGNGHSKRCRHNITTVR
ncbi:hypothetical protein R1sor_017581 [Riccia sorocarpa]|uniref:Neprosin PEP catalytic domain-containing protein n=1 Tax=Riccia sorocarpa TaxID=122646 RepID=A0ABD3IDH0_9MARC